jgi:DNA-directed RNA polymerase specialized sigma24 family protein
MTSECFHTCQELLLRAAARQARRLARRYNLQPADRDDAFQEIALDAWHRLKGYRASRGELGAFLGMVTLHQARKIEARLRRRTAEVSLEAPIRNGAHDPELQLADTLSEEDGLPALLGNQVNGFARVELILDLCRAIAWLPPDARQLCACLAHESAAAARCACGLSNTGLYRQIEELRLHLRSFGFGTR